MPPREFIAASAVPVAGIVTSRLLSICAALYLQAVAIGPTLAQSSATQSTAQPSGTFRERIEAAARDFADNPRFKGLTQQQRVDRVEFVVGNMLYVLLHEVGHALIHEMDLPVLGRNEDAADEFAAITLIRVGSAFSQHVLANAAKGWFLSDRRNREIGEPMLFYDEHGLDAQRAYEIVCLMVGADSEKFKDLANETGLPAERQKDCKEEYERASRAWETLLKPHRRTADQPKTQIDVEYGDGQGTFDVFAKTFRSSRMLETIAGVLADQYAWPIPFKMEMQVCGHPQASYEDKTHTITICYEEARDFVELYRAYGALPLDLPSSKSARTTGTDQKKESKRPRKARPKK